MKAAFAVLLLLATAAPAEQPAGDAPAAAPSSWNASIAHDQKANPANWSDGSLQLRIYGDEGRRGRRFPAFAVDTAAELEICPDGTLHIRELIIGGLKYSRGEPCETDSAPDKQQDEEQLGAARVIQCDARTWVCRSD